MASNVEADSELKCVVRIRHLVSALFDIVKGESSASKTRALISPFFADSPRVYALKAPGYFAIDHALLALTPALHFCSRTRLAQSDLLRSRSHDCPRSGRIGLDHSPERLLGRVSSTSYTALC